MAWSKLIWVFLAGIIGGSLVWALSIPITGFREPFDSSGPYYGIAIFVADVFAALPSPRYWWMAPIGVFVGERLYAFVMLPETRTWVLFGIVMSFLILTWVPAAIGSFLTFAGSRLVAQQVPDRNDSTIDE